MTAALRSEWVKLSSVRMPLGMLVGVLVLVLLGVVGTMLTAGDPNGPPALDTEEGMDALLSNAAGGTPLGLVLGILGMAGEFRHGTATPTFLVTPRRSRIVFAKLAMYAGLGAAYAVVALLALLAVVLPWLAVENVAAPSVSLLATALGGVLLSNVLYAMLGVAVGALIRNQLAAVLGALAWTFIIEGLLVAFLPDVGKWLPGGAAAALTQTFTPQGDLLPLWAGALVLLAYTAAIAGAGTRFVLRRDVT